MEQDAGVHLTYDSYDLIYTWNIFWFWKTIEDFINGILSENSFVIVDLPETI